MSTVMEYGVKRPIGERINFRLLTIAVVFATLVGYPVYRVVRLQMTHSIEKNGDRLDVDLKALGNFQFNDATGTVADVPPDFRALDGKKVALEGFVYSTDRTDRVNKFEFVYNIQKCCFGGPPKVQERVFAKLGGDGIPNFGAYQEVRLVGTLHVKVTKDSDADANKITAVYTIDVNDWEQL